MRNLRTWAVAIIAVALPIASTWPTSGQAPSPNLALYGFGASESNQLTISATNVSTPFVISARGLTAVDAGRAHALGLTAEGGVVAWGLGATDDATPQVVEGLPGRAIAIAAGEGHSLALLEDGNVFAWGANLDGQLGIDPALNAHAATPQLVAGLPAGDVVDVRAGARHSMALTSSGAVFTWGDNSAGQVGDGSTQDSHIPHQTIASNATAIGAGSSHSLAVVSGLVMAWGLNAEGQVTGRPSSPVLVPVSTGVTDARSVAGGGGHSLAITMSGNSSSVSTWGSNSFGQLGRTPSAIVSIASAEFVSGAVAIDAGAAHSVAITDDGMAWSWGDDSRGQLGAGGVGQRPFPGPVRFVTVGTAQIAAGDRFTLLLTANPEITVIPQAPLNVSCSQPFTTTVDLIGYDSVAGAEQEIMLVLDESGSISSADFRRLKDFAMNVVRSQDVSSQMTRFGVVMFSSAARNIVPANLTGSRQELLSRINSVAQEAGATCIACGLELARDLLATSGRPNVPRRVIVVTDGISSPSSTAPLARSYAAQLTAQGVSVVTVGIGSSVSATELRSLASDPGLAFLSPDFNSLGGLIARFFVSPGLRAAPGQTAASLLMAPNGMTMSGNASYGNVSQQSPTAPLTWQLPYLGRTSQARLVASMRNVNGNGGVKNLFTTFQLTLGNVSTDVPSPSIAITGCVASLNVSPTGTQSPIGSTHKITATVTDDLGAPVGGVSVGFMITSGPNTRPPFNTATASNGMASFSYSGNVSGTDVIRVKALNLEQVVEHTWVLPNQAPKANAGVDRTVVLAGNSSTAVVIDGTASIDDGNLQPLTYEWTVNGQVVSTDPSFVQLLKVGVHTFTLTVNDGQFVDSDSVTVSVVDKTPPSVVPQVEGVLGTNEWYTSPVAVRWIVDDAESSVTTACPAVDISSETTAAGELVKCVAASAGGSTTEAVTVKLDLTQPVITPTVQGTAGNDGWYTSDVQVSWTTSDPQSDVAGTVGCDASFVTVDTNAAAYTCAATNGAGLKSTHTVTVKRDTTPPSIAVPDAIAAGATSSSGAVVNFDAPVVTDATSGVNAASVLCTPSSGSLFALGTTAVTCNAEDAAGNRRTAVFNVTVSDATPPAIQPIVTGVAGPAGWYLDDVHVAWSVDDPQTGVAATTGCDLAIVNTDTAGTTFTCSATNGAGSSSSASVTVRRDTTPPALPAPADVTVLTSSPAGIVVTYPAATASDAGAGVASIVCLPASGATFALGTTAVHCSATDAVGLTASASFGVTVILDTDVDGDPDVSDPDDDNDSVPDDEDAFPTDATESEDTDGDGVGDRADSDVDNDGVPNAIDLCPLVGGLAPSGCAVSIAPPEVFAGAATIKSRRTVPLAWQYSVLGSVMDSADAAPVLALFRTPCGGPTAGTPIPIEDAGRSGLRYDASTRTWQFNWKVDVAEGCYYLTIRHGVTGQVDGPFTIRVTR